MLSTMAELLVLSSVDGIVRSFSTFGELAAQSGLLPAVFEDVMGGEFNRMNGSIVPRGPPEGLKAIGGRCGK